MDPMFEASKKKTSIGSLVKKLKGLKPVVLSHDIPPGTKLTFIDVAHSLATIHMESKFNRFSALIDAANDWLKRHYLWKVENCETVNLVFKNEKLDDIDYGATQRLLQSSANFDIGDSLILKALRLWLSRREDMPEMKRNIDIQCIAYQTFLPKSCQYYENQIGWEQLDDVIETINEALRYGQICGQLLNIESVNYDASEDWVVDTEVPIQREFVNKQETALRVYYVTNAPIDQSKEIAVFDFVPEIMSANSPPKFEPFSSLLYKLQEFLEDNRDFMFLNCQSLDIKFRTLDEIHTHFMVHHNDIGYYLRVLRLITLRTPEPNCVYTPVNHFAYEDISHPNEVKSTTSEEDKEDVVQEMEEPEQVDSISLTEGTGAAQNPIQPVLNIESHYFEIIHHNTLHGPFYPVKRAIEEFMEREEWCEDDRHQKWNYLCAETIMVLAKDETDIERKVEISLFSNRHNILLMPRQYNAVRIYFDTSLIVQSRRSNNAAKLTKSKSESYEKDFKTNRFRQRSLPDSAIQFVGNTAETVKTVKNKISNSITCAIM